MYKYLLIFVLLTSCSSIRNTQPMDGGKGTGIGNDFSGKTDEKVTIKVEEDCDFYELLKSSTAKKNCFYIPDDEFHQYPVLKYNFKDGSRILLQDSKGKLLSEKKALLYNFSIINNSTCVRIEDFFGATNYWILEIKNDYITVTKYIELPFENNWKWSTKPFTQLKIFSSKETPQISKETLLLKISNNSYVKKCSILKKELKSIKSLNFFETSNKLYNKETIDNLAEKEFLPRLLVCAISGDSECQNILYHFTTYFDFLHFEEGYFAERIMDYQHECAVYNYLTKNQIKRK